MNTLAALLIVAVIDTGLPVKTSAPLCASGHKTFVNNTIKDTLGHSTGVSNTIAKAAGTKGYCLLHLKFTDKSEAPMSASRLIADAITYASNLGASAINISAGGYGRSFYEERAIKQALDKGIVIIAAAGNEGLNIDKIQYYPASSDPRVTVVSCKRRNYGRAVDVIKSCQGENIMGTSAATAIATGEWIKDKLQETKK